MKNKFYTPMLSGLMLLFSLTLSCKKDKPAPVPPALTVTDANGNVYQTVKIGTQTWMAENLKSTKFNDGSAIPYVDVQANWANLNTPAFAYYAFDSANKPTYGALYNYYAATDPKIAPVGWHVPTEAEWLILLNSLGGNILAGDKLKEAGNTHWSLPSSIATNESGFTALPGGFIDVGGFSQNLTSSALYWTVTETDATHARFISLSKSSGLVQSATITKGLGLSLRLVKD